MRFINFWLILKKVLKNKKVTKADAENFILTSMYVYGIWAADGTHQTLTYSTLTLQYSSFCGTKICIPACKKSVPIVCDQEVTVSRRRVL
jgi:hypothetical protein